MPPQKPLSIAGPMSDLQIAGPMSDLPNPDQMSDLERVAIGMPPKDQRTIVGKAADLVIPPALRIGGAIAGGMAGAPAGPAGVIGGGAIGSGLGETAAEGYEVWRGLRKEINPTQIAVQTGLGALPVIGKTAPTVGRAIVARGTQGAVMGGVSDAATELAEGRTPTVGGVARGAAIGTVLGGAGGALESKIRMPKVGVESPNPSTLKVAGAVTDIDPRTPALSTEALVKPEGATVDLGPDARTVANYEGPNRRVTGGVSPTGIERRNAPIDLTNPVDAAKTMMQENPRIIKEATELSQRARASRMEAPPREPVQETPTFVNPEQPVIMNSVENAERPHVSAPKIEKTARALGREIPEQKPLTRERIEGEGTLIQHMPEPLRKGIAEVIDENNHFGAQRRGVQTNERTAALADYITVNSREKLKPGTALNAEETMAYARAVASTQDKIDTLSKKITEGQATDFDIAAMFRAQAEQVVNTASFLGARAETGRALQIHKKMAEIIESQDVIAIQQALKNPKFRNDIQEFAKQWAALPDDKAKLDFLRRHQQTTWSDTLRSFYFANILSGVKTHLRNVIGNTANAVFNTASSVASVGYDIARHATTGAPRTIFASEIPHRIVGAALGVKQGIDDALFTLQHGYTPKSLATFDVPRKEMMGGGKNPFNWTGRALEAEDQFFYGIAYNQELYARLYAKARGEASKQGLKGDTMGDFIQRKMAEWKAHVPEDVAKATEQAALRTVYKEDPGKFVQKLLALKEDGGKLGLALNFVLPFIKTPANIIRQGVEATPIGVFTSQNMAAIDAGGRSSAEAFGRITTGTIGLAMLAWWASQGKISGEGPADPEQRAALMESGWRPNSVKIGDAWVDYNNFLQPISQPLFAVANAWEQYRENGKDPDVQDIVSATMKTAAATGGAVLSQSFLSGLSDLNNALADPVRYGGRYVGRAASGFVPFSGLARNIAQETDRTVRDPDDRPVEAIKSIIPGLSSKVAPKLDRFGEPVQRPAASGVNPVAISRESKDPIILELNRLRVDSIGVPPSRLDATKTSPEIVLSVEERQEIGRATRAALQRLFALPRWKELDEDVARDQIARTVQQARTQLYPAIRARHRAQ